MITSAVATERLRLYEMPGSYETPESLFPEIETVRATLKRLEEEGYDAYAELAPILSVPIPPMSKEQLNAFFLSQQCNGKPVWSCEITDKNDPTHELTTYSKTVECDTEGKAASCDVCYSFGRGGRLRRREIVEQGSDFPGDKHELKEHESFIYDDGYLKAYSTWSADKPDRDTTYVFDYTYTVDNEGKPIIGDFDKVVRNTYDPTSPTGISTSEELVRRPEQREQL